jgi:glycerophosphoryl diester phosphodiesterase
MWVIGHRGASGYAPENTMAAFRRAAELGARFIETDLRLTRDVKVVAIHDPNLDRTSNGRGPVDQLSLAELRALDAGAWFHSARGESFAGERIPTLEEILAFSVERDMTLYLEIKTDASWGTENAILGVLRDSGQAARVIILSFDARTLQAVHRLDGSLMTGFLCELPSGANDLVERALQADARQIVPRSDLVTPALITAAHDAGLAVVTWTANDPQQIRRLIDAGVDGIMGDYPDRIVHALQV